MKLAITLVRSPIGYSERQRRVVRSLGLRRLGQTVVHEDTPTIRGMVRKVQHMLRVEPLADGAGGPGPAEEGASERA